MNNGTELPMLILAWLYRYNLFKVVKYFKNLLPAHEKLLCCINIKCAVKYPSQFPLDTTRQSAKKMSTHEEQRLYEYIYIFGGSRSHAKKKNESRMCMHVSRTQWVFKKCGRVIYRKGHKELNADGKFHWATDFGFLLRIKKMCFFL
jgi:hypothetical protein